MKNVDGSDSSDSSVGCSAAVRSLLAEGDLSVDPQTVPIDDAASFALLHPVIKRWWIDEFGEHIPANGGVFTPPQKEAIPHIASREHCLVCAPTGSGKTLASFTAILNSLFTRAISDDGLENNVYCLYISPLKALANDIHRNLATPLQELTERFAAAGKSVDIRHAIRHGDTERAVKQQMLAETPHILNTTPETLAILLNSPKFKDKLASVEYIIVDEIHALADNKRGTHLSVSLERLERMTDRPPTRIGCSATVEPLDELGDFLVGQSGGESRPCHIVDARFMRPVDLTVISPAADLIETPRDLITERLYTQLIELIEAHSTTIIFTNSRSGAERALQQLRDRADFDESNSGCHHGSLSKTRRQDIESQLKAGTLDVVTTSTSLELGIDMPDVDLVVQIGSPKSVAALLQRVGRAGHQMGETVKGRVFALEQDELLECTVMAKKALDGFIDRVSIPENAHDVAAQHVYGMAINAVREEAEVKDILTSAYPYRTYSDTKFDQLLQYLTSSYPGLEAQHVYPKIWRDTNDDPDGEHHYPEFPVGVPLIGKRGRLARVIYMTNIGTIPDAFSCDVLTRDGSTWIGQLDEQYLDTLTAGDVFVLGGDRYKYVYRRGSKVYVEPTEGSPTVPSWFSERLPLNPDLAAEIRTFQQSIIDRLDEQGAPAVRRWLRSFPVDENTVRTITRIFDTQQRFAGLDSITTTDQLAIEVELDREAYARRYYIHTLFGRHVNDGLARILSHICEQELNATVTVAVTDHGVLLSLPLNRKIDVTGLLRDIAPDDVRPILRESLADTDLLKRYFRMNATRSLMILKRYRGSEKSASQQQVSSEMLLGLAASLDEFAVLEETYREILDDRLACPILKSLFADLENELLTLHSIRVSTPSPRAFGLATLASSSVVQDDETQSQLEYYHRQVQDAIE